MVVSILVMSSSMIVDRAGAGAGVIARRNKRRRRQCVDSTSSYRQLGEIGAGSFGAVVEAWHRRTGQAVAIKTFRRRDRDGRISRAAAGGGVGELLREACFLAACGGHPNLVGLRGVARSPRTRRYALVTEHGGRSLRGQLKERLRADGLAFPEAEVRRVMRQLLAGAEAMHARRIIHRDIKTGNVLVGEDGGGGAVVKICDYGLAVCTAAAGAGAPPYARVGTVGYMAPEVLTRRTDYDERADAWSLGCVMAELLSGELLLKADGGGTMMRQLDRMFDVLGAPGVEALCALAPPLVVGKVLRRLARQPRVRHHGRLRELLPGEVLSREGFRVLEGLLTLNPKERLTAAAALRLPWFTDTVDTPASGATTTSTPPAAPFVRVVVSV